MEEWPTIRELSANPAPLIASLSHSVFRTVARAPSEKRATMSYSFPHGSPARSRGRAVSKISEGSQLKEFAGPKDAPGLKWQHIAAATIGNALEFYDFLTYAFFSIQIGHAFHGYGFVRFLSVMAIKLQALYALLALLAPSPAAY